MTLFQAIVYAIVNSFSQFLPISYSAHQTFVPLVTGWPIPEGPLDSMIHLGFLGALLLYFRHDWLSMFSCFLQVLIFRERPMTLDERLPFFLFLTALPTLLCAKYLGNQLPAFSVFSIAGVFLGATFVLGYLEKSNKNSKGMFDWKWRDALFLGIFQVFGIIPGGDPFTGILFGAFFLNYQITPAVKYAYYSLFPILVMQVLTQWQGKFEGFGSNWLILTTSGLTALLTSLLVIGGLLRHIQSQRLSQYLLYRVILGAGIILIFWLKN